MKRELNKFAMTLFLVIALTAMLALTPSAYSIEMTEQKKALTFMDNVVGLDMTKYEAEIISNMDLPADASGVAKSVILYNLKSQGSTLEVICNFRNNTLVSININSIEGSPQLAQPITNALDSAKNILDNYISHSKVSYVKPIRAMLNTINELKPTEVVSGDMRMTIKTENYTYIEWMNTPNGIHNMYNRIILIFQNGVLKTFTDSWNRYSIGCNEVSVTKEQALSIAKDRAQSFSYKIGNTTISNMTILNNPEFMRAELTMQPRENVLYPHWELLLPLDQLYPGMTTSIRVTLWADTGEVDSIKATGSLGALPSEESINTPAQSSVASSSNQDQLAKISNQPISIDLIIGIAAIAVTVAIAIVIMMKKRNK